MATVYHTVAIYNFLFLFANKIKNKQKNKYTTSLELLNENKVYKPRDRRWIIGKY